MKLKLKDVLTHSSNLQAIYSKKMPPSICYAVCKNADLLEKEVAIIEKGRVGIIEKYAVKDSNGEPVVKDNAYDLGDNREKFVAEYTEYLETETELGIQIVSEAELQKFEDERYDVMTPIELARISFMIATEG